MGRRGESSSKEPTQRQLRVGEEVRHAVSQVLMRGEAHIAELERYSITVSEVRIGPDLKNATAYVTTLGGVENDKAIKVLNKFAPQLRRLIGKRVHLKYIPKLYFKADKSFEIAGRLNQILNQPEVQRDLKEESNADDGATA